MKTVEHSLETLPEPADQRRRALQNLGSVPDEAIDTSDIAELDDVQWANAERGKFYRPVKQQITARVDADVLAWLKASGRGYQTRLNKILREAMQREAARKDRPGR